MIFDRVKSLFKMYFRPLNLWLGFPWVLVVVLGFFWIPFARGYAKEVLGFGLFTLAMISLIWVLPNSKLKRFWACFSAVTLAFFSLTKLTFYYQYGTKISASALFVIFETNGTEAGDFLSEYFSLPTIALLLVMVIYLFLAFRRFRSAKNWPDVKMYQSAFALIFATVCFYGIHWKFKEENIPMTTVSAYGEYKQTKALLKQQLAQPEGDNFGVQYEGELDATYVVVIGESTTRRHMQLYNYDRATNPKLSNRLEELAVYDSVISPHVHTILAFEKIFTLKTFDDPKPEKNVSLVQLANQAGLRTYWISGQRPVGIHESIPTVISSAANFKNYLNSDNYNDDFYDEVLLEPFKKALAEQGPKVIFLHLMGTHVGYYKRYPEEFTVFKNAETDKQQHIDHYDNAVIYNDHILERIITILSAAKGTNKMLYFSDHGDDVFDEHNGIGHNEYRATRTMYEVPMLIWPRSITSKDSVFNNLYKRYSLEDLPHTFADFCEFKFKGYSRQKSLLSKTFRPGKRIIKDTIDYDTDW